MVIVGTTSVDDAKIYFAHDAIGVIGVDITCRASNTNSDIRMESTLDGTSHSLGRLGRIDAVVRYDLGRDACHNFSLVGISDISAWENSACAWGIGNDRSDEARSTRLHGRDRDAVLYQMIDQTIVHTVEEIRRYTIGKPREGCHRRRLLHRSG